MGMFKSEKPRAFSHQYIYVDERKEKLAKIEENAKRDLGILPPKELTAEERIRGKFVESTTHLRRRKESGKKPIPFIIKLFLIVLLMCLFYAISNGII